MLTKINYIKRNYKEKKDYILVVKLFYSNMLYL